MIDAILRFALRNRFVVLLVAILALVAGGFTLARLPVDVFPDITAPTRANRPVRSRPSGFGTANRAGTVRLSGSRV